MEEDGVGCRRVHAEEMTEGKQRVSYFPGISAQSVGSKQLCMHLVTIPPGGRGKAHLHAKTESAVYVLSGEGIAWYGPGLREQIALGPGDFLFIPAGEPHMPVNASTTMPFNVVLARTDPNEQESIVLLTELEDIPHTRLVPAAS